MKKISLLICMLVLVIGIASASTMTRNVPSQVTPGQVFTVTYNPSNTPATYFVAVEDSMSGGCTVSGTSDTTFKSVSTGGSITASIKAPSSGSCTFSGIYYFVNEAQANFPTATVTVSSNGCTPTTCSSLGYECGTWSDGCGGSLNCGTCSGGETCSSGQCSSSGGYEPPAFDLDMVLFTVGTYEVTLMNFLIIIGLVFLASVLLK